MCVVLVPNRELMVVETCFEVVFCHANVSTCGAGCCLDCSFLDNAIYESFFHQIGKGPCSCNNCMSFPLSVVSHSFNIFLLWFLIMVAIAAVAYFKVVSVEKLVQLV